MTILTTVLLALTLLNLAFIAWQWLVAHRFPLHRRVAPSLATPPVTFLKPLHGCDPETKECLRSWFDQDYAGPVQILLGVASPTDPVCGVVRDLIAAHPQCDAQLLVCGESCAAQDVPNAKVSTVIQLQKMARHEILIVSDADVRVPPDLIGQVVSAFREPDVGLVCCFYRIANPANFAMHWEAFATNADFWSQVLQARSLKPLDFALGAVMAVTRRHLEAVGGFDALADYLADDFQLGNRIARHGARVEISPVVVACYEPPMSWRQTWTRQLRWARTIRFCRPFPYAISLVSNGTLWPLLCLLVRHGWVVTIAAGTGLCLRGVSAVYLETKMTGKVSLRALVLAPLKDLLQVALWVLAFLGKEVHWRGSKYQVLAEGKLLGQFPMTPPTLNAVTTRSAAAGRERFFQ